MLVLVHHPHVGHVAVVLACQDHVTERRDLSEREVVCACVGRGGEIAYCILYMLRTFSDIFYFCVLDDYWMFLVMAQRLFMRVH